MNRNGGEILGQQAFRSLAELPGPPELVVIAVPVGAFEQGVDDALAAGARGIVAITAGLGEVDDGGKELESRVVDKVRSAGAVMLGPNCLGVYDAAAALDLGMNEFEPGALGIISQSGNLALELSLLGAQYGIGISRFASLGNQADIEAAELVEAFAADEHTRVIGVYCEDFRDGRAFARAGEAALAGRASRSILLAAGGSEAGARAAASHTGALASDSAAIEAACRAAGIMRVTTPKQLIDCVLACLAPHRPKGRRVAIVGDGGGTGVVTADLVTEAGLELPTLSPELASRLTAIAPTIVTANPVDLAGAGEQDFWNFERVNTAVLESGEVDAVIFTGYFGGYSQMNETFAAIETEVGHAIARAAERERPAAARPGDVLGRGSRPRAPARAACPSTGTSRPSSIPSTDSSAGRTGAPTAWPRSGEPAPPIAARRLLRVARAPRRRRRRVRCRPPRSLGRRRRARPPPTSATRSCSRRSACSTSRMRAVWRSALPTTPRSLQPPPTCTSGSHPSATRSRRWSPPRTASS